MHSIQNDKLKISVKNTGAELCEISSIKNKTDFMWDANPDVWAGFAPNLFPIIGALKDDGYIYENKIYALPKHGFIRNNDAVKCIEQTNDRLTFGLRYSDDLLKIYPFKFDFTLSYVLKDNVIELIHTIKNLDNKNMYFSLGGHPAFKCPVYKDENYEDDHDAVAAVAAAAAAAADFSDSCGDDDNDDDDDEDDKAKSAVYDDKAKSKR